MVTVIGVLNLLSGVIIIGFFDLTFSKQLPAWVYFFFAFTTFMGQTFDAIDGKHARNTGRSSPLGQLMDHGCDAFSNSFIIIMIAQSHTMRGSVELVMLQALVQVCCLINYLIKLSFFVLTWEEHHTGVLCTHIDNVGVTEFQFVAMAILMTPIFIGQFFSETTFPLLNMEISITDCIVYIVAIL
jgi:phosphatidylglycerophosphate synthase